MVKTGARIGCPQAEKVIVPNSVAELHNRFPENRISLNVIDTIDAAGSSILPFFLVPDAHQNLDDNACITNTLHSFMTNEATNEPLDHFIIHGNFRSNEPLTILILDGHTCHKNEEFLLKAEFNNVLFQFLPSH
ncbi:putative sda1 domain protein [Erysiphe neolycopersici]|uniref:Putative sda1 domain protein n=1 Tax=Erysiphe neolycopersici TaxID=212602 RepID=A0A420HNZ2_9PEZI|nr:putative sda1 domain protein [Erysiphe neolycopersici]